MVGKVQLIMVHEFYASVAGSSILTRSISISCSIRSDTSSLV
jgi:hypothetical protein